MQTRMKWMLVLGVAVVTAACGDSKSSLLPTAPSALSADSASVDASTADGHYGTTANGPKPGNGNGNGNSGNGNGGNGNGNGNQPAPGKSVVQFEGLIEALDGRGSIKVNGQWIAVTADTVIRHGNRQVPLADLKPTDRVHVRANRVEGQALLEALEINLQNPGAGDGVSSVPVPDPNPLVSVTAVDNSANESGAAGTNTGMFRLSRTGTATQLGQSLSVSFALGGTATAGDYAAMPLTATFGANESTVDLTLTPVNDFTMEPAETVVLTLSPGATYDLAEPSTATINVTDDPLPLVNVTTSGSPSEAPTRGRFMVSRSNGISTTLTVTITLTGTAENGVDYPTVPTTLTFGPGESLITINLWPTQDNAFEETETVILTVVDGDFYDLGASSTATMMIVNVGGS